jgi:hypothetical protein
VAHQSLAVPATTGLIDRTPIFAARLPVFWTRSLGPAGRMTASDKSQRKHRLGWKLRYRKDARFILENAG